MIWNLFILMIDSCKILVKEPDTSLSSSSKIECENIHKCIYHIISNINMNECCDEFIKHIKTINNHFFEAISENNKSLFRCDKDIEEEHYINVIKKFKTDCSLDDGENFKVSDKDILREVCPNFNKYFEEGPILDNIKIMPVNIEDQDIADYSIASAFQMVFSSIMFIGIVSLLFFILKKLFRKSKRNEATVEFVNEFNSDLSEN